MENFVNTSRDAAIAAIRIAMTTTREEERKTADKYKEIGIRTAAVDLAAALLKARWQKYWSAR